MFATVYLSLLVVDVAQREHREDAEDRDAGERVAKVVPAVVPVHFKDRLDVALDGRVLERDTPTMVATSMLGSA
jgi:hypothetical protein